jgi:hypothetical protein
MNYAGLSCSAFLLLYFPFCGFLGWFIRRKQAAAIARLRPDPVAPPPVHVHILDLERSKIHVTDIGGVFAHCIVAGCEESIYIAPGMARSSVAEWVGIRA